MKYPLVSVVIPYYKHYEYIELTVESVFNQLYKNIELIIVDDGSNDGDRDVLEELKHKYPFKLFRKDNGGISSALNFAIRESRGEYISIIGSDDIMMNNRVQEQVEILNNNADLSGCSSYVERIDKQGLFLNNKNPQPRGILGFNYFYSNKFYFPAPAAMYRVSALEDVGCFSEAVAIEDWDLLLKLTSKGHKLMLDDKILTKYRIHASTSSNYLKMYKGVLEVANKYKSTSSSRYYSIKYYQCFRYLYKSLKVNELKMAYEIIKLLI